MMLFDLLCAVSLVLLAAWAFLANCALNVQGKEITWLQDEARALRKAQLAELAERITARMREMEGASDEQA